MFGEKWELVLAGILDHERCPLADDVLAERVAERCLTVGRRGLRQAVLAGEELAIISHQAQKSAGAAEAPADDPSQAVEDGLGRGVEQAGPAHGRDSLGVAERSDVILLRAQERLRQPPDGGVGVSQCRA